MSAAERAIHLLERELACKEAELQTRIEANDKLKKLLSDSMQIISDLVDPNCPMAFKEVAEAELLRIADEYFEIY